MTSPTIEFSFARPSLVENDESHPRRLRRTFLRTATSGSGDVTQSGISWKEIPSGSGSELDPSSVVWYDTEAAEEDAWLRENGWCGVDGKVDETFVKSGVKALIHDHELSATAADGEAKTHLSKLSMVVRQRMQERGGTGTDGATLGTCAQAIGDCLASARRATREQSKHLAALWDCQSEALSSLLVHDDDANILFRDWCRDFELRQQPEVNTASVTPSMSRQDEAVSVIELQEKHHLALLQAIEDHSAHASDIDNRPMVAAITMVRHGDDRVTIKPLSEFPFDN